MKNGGINQKRGEFTLIIQILKRGLDVKTMKLQIVMLENTDIQSIKDLRRRNYIG